jgi:hypothetical protein
MGDAAAAQLAELYSSLPTSWKMERSHARSACALSGALDATIGNHILHLECPGAPRATGRAFGLISIVRADVNNLHRQLLAFWARGWKVVRHIGGVCDRSIKDKRWVMEDTFATPVQLDRLAKLGGIVSLQAQGYNGVYEAPVKAYGKERAERQTQSATCSTAT